MFEKLIRFSIEQRWLVLLAALGMAALGVFSYQKLPIDAVMLPLFCGVLSSLLTRLFCAVPRTSVSRIAWG